MPDMHAILSASKSKQWMACTPSARLNQKLSDAETRALSLGMEIAEKRNDDVSVPDILALFYENQISGIDTGTDHAVSFYLQHEGLACRHVFRRDREVILDILLGKNRLSGRNGSDQRNIHRLAARKIKLIVDHFNRAGLGRIPPDVAVLLQCFQV